MKSIVTDIPKKDTIEIVKQTQEERKTVFLGTVRAKRGHSLFEINIKESMVVLAEFDAPAAVKFEDAAKGSISLRNKITKKPGCYYVSALNIKNAKKVFFNKTGIRLS